VRKRATAHKEIYSFVFSPPLFSPFVD